MKAAIYQLRSGGILLPRPTEAKHGNLLLSKTDQGEGLCARLQQDGRDILPPLFQAQVTRISQHGMVLKGSERSRRGGAKGRTSLSEQTWWALVHTDDLFEFHEDGDPLDIESGPGVPPGERPKGQNRLEPTK